MPAEIVSLNHYRKAKKKAEKEQRKAANRSRFGRSKKDRTRDNELASRAARELDGKRLEEDPADGR